MAQINDAQRRRIRKAVAGYIRRYPRAADTVEGIVTRWLPRSGYEGAPDQIDDVLADMVAEGLLQARPLPDGKILFRVPDAKVRSRRAGK